MNALEKKNGYALRVVDGLCVFQEHFIAHTPLRIG